MKIISFKCNDNSNKCILEIELEGEKIILQFTPRRYHDDRDGYSKAKYSGNTYQPSDLGPTPSEIEALRMQDAKHELSEYLVERLFREHDAMKTIKK